MNRPQKLSKKNKQDGKWNQTSIHFFKQFNEPSPPHVASKLAIVQRAVTSCTAKKSSSRDKIPQPRRRPKKNERYPVLGSTQSQLKEMSTMSLISLPVFFTLNTRDTSAGRKSLIPLAAWSRLELRILKMLTNWNHVVLNSSLIEQTKNLFRAFSHFLHKGKDSSSFHKDFPSLYSVASG